MSKRKYTIRKAPGSHLDFTMRLALQSAWNEYVRRLLRISIGTFAKEHGLSKATWHRELHRGAVGPIVKVDGKFQYPEYSAELAQSKVDEGKAQMGAPMRLTAVVADRFRVLVVVEKRSPYDARQILSKEFPDKPLPCLRTFYNHIDAGDIGVAHGQTPYHPGLRRKAGPKAHPAKVLPNRRRISERPPEANRPTEIGHKEFDTVVSCAAGTGGLLTVYDRVSKYLGIERLASVCQQEVSRGMRRLKARGILEARPKSATTDNGCETSHQEELESILGCNVYYTRAYASYEKGGVENVNRMIRRWFPKGTDFSKVSERDVRAVENIINSIHRKSLNGLSAHEYHLRHSSVA